jgi:hypothetical protein
MRVKKCGVNMDNNDFKKEMEALKKRLDLLESKRIYQQDIMPQSIKNRAMGEANSYIYGGKTAKLPTIGNVINTNSFTVYFDYQTNKLYIYNGTAFKSVTLS